MNPFPSLGQVYVCDLLPISLSPKGICVYNSQCLTNDGRPQQSGISIELNKIASVLCSNNSIYINNSFTIKCGSGAQADSIARIIKRLILTAEKDRDALIKAFLGEGLDTDLAKHILNETTDLLRWLRRYCVVLFIFLFILSPILAIQIGLTQSIIPIAIVMFIMATCISIFFYKAHRKVYPQAKGERIANLVKMILCPPVAIRANDIITSKTLGTFSPIAISKILLKKEDFLLFARRHLLDLRYPMVYECKEQFGTEIVVWHNAALYEIYCDYIYGFDRTQMNLLDVSKPWDNQSKSYCPRCLCQFQIDNGECCNCVGVGLVPFNTGGNKE